ncbi:gluconokinase [Shewanella waksmanii]|uniref:gluconokinase n=1 Tax=Shewanella waksmanii TaxID=213783 RepID=UPI000686EFCD|nr:gluconokinase, GntK/IdnK-type [Shewanella waksmanii]
MSSVNMQADNSARLIIVMGISGCGKSALAQAIAEHLPATYIEADDHHSPAAKQKMAAGSPLTEQDRAPWIARLLAVVAQQLQQGNHCVLAYSGLKAHHRAQFLSLSDNSCFIHLDIDVDEIKRRLSARENHFFNPSLLDSQLQALEPAGPYEQLHCISQSLPPQQLLAKAMEILHANDKTAH